MLTSRQRSAWLQQLFFLGPAVLFFTAIVIVPFVLGMYYSLTDWNGVSDHVQWVGLDNFKRILSDKNFFKSFGFTIKYTFASVILMNLVGFGLALLVTQSIKLKSMFRTIFFMPHVIGGLLLGFIWQFIFVRGFSTLGDLTGLSFFNLPWLGTENTAFWGIVIVGVWQYAGYLMVIYIAGLVGIPKELIEAAEIDGVNGWQKVRHITIPLVMPAITVCYFLAISSCFKMFDLNLSLTNGGPFNSTESLALNIYTEAFSHNRYGLGTAKAFLFFVLVGVITMIQVRVTKKREVEA